MRRVSSLDWDDLRILLALETGGSITAAARALKVDASTVSRRLAALEGALGVQLVVRTPDGIKMSEAGGMALDAARAVDASVRDLVTKIASADRLPRGVVRVSVTDGFAPIVYDALAPTRARHPDLHLEVIVANERVDLARGEVDVAVRLFRESSGDLVVRKVGTIGWSLYAGAHYVSKRGMPTVTTLGEHDVVGYEAAAARGPGARWLDANARAARVVVRGPSVTSVVAAVRAGMGCSALPCFIASRDALLVRVIDEIIAENEIFLVTTAANKEIARVRVVLDALDETFRAMSRMFSGVS